MVRHGNRPPRLLAENNAEGLFLYVKIEPFLEKLRARAGRPPSATAEWVGTGVPRGPADLRTDQGPRRAARGGAGLRARRWPRDRRRRPRLRRPHRRHRDADLRGVARRLSSAGARRWASTSGSTRSDHGGFDPLDHLDTLLGGALDGSSARRGEGRDRERLRGPALAAGGGGSVLPGRRGLGLGRRWPRAAPAAGYGLAGAPRHPGSNRRGRGPRRRAQGQAGPGALPPRRLGASRHLPPASSSRTPRTGMRALAPPPACAASPRPSPHPPPRPPDVDLVLDSLAEGRSPRSWRRCSAPQVAHPPRPALNGAGP